MRPPVIVILAAVLLAHAQAGKQVSISFEKHQLSSEFFSEGANAGDFNRDGKIDIVSGPYWYEGPAFAVRHEIYSPQPFDPHAYSHNFFAFVDDFNDDGWPDVM